MAKKLIAPTEGNPLDALDARVRALERHNGWTPGECPSDDYIGNDEPVAPEPLKPSPEPKEE